MISLKAAKLSKRFYTYDHEKYTEKDFRATFSDKEVFYSLKNILKHNAKWNFIWGERSSGKTYSVKKLVVEYAYKHQCNDATFVIVRRWDEDFKKGKSKDYFSDLNIKKLTKNEYNTIITIGRKLFFANEDDDGNIERGCYIGRFESVNEAERLKSSTPLNNVYHILFDEAITRQSYVDNEPVKLMSLVSSILRKREGKVWMLANPDNPYNPYIEYWGLVNFLNQPQGTIDEYLFKTYDGDEVKMCIERTLPMGKASKMAFGKAAESIDGGKIEVKLYPKLFHPFKEYNQAYCYSLKLGAFAFNIYALQNFNHDDEKPTLYVCPCKKREIPINGTNEVYVEYHYKDRLITDEYSEKIKHTKHLFSNIKAERMISALYYKKQICFSDNITGANFEASIRNAEFNPFALL